MVVCANSRLWCCYSWFQSCQYRWHIYFRWWSMFFFFKAHYPLNPIRAVWAAGYRIVVTSFNSHSLSRSISSIILCVVYHSTANGQTENEDLCNHIWSNFGLVTDGSTHSLVFIIVDSNPTGRCLDIKDLTQPNNLKQMVNFKTRDSGILDWVLTNRPSIFQFSHLLKITKSDHFPVLAIPITVNTSRLQTRKVRVQDQKDSAWRTFGRVPINKDWSSVLAAESCKEKFDTFSTGIQTAVDT